MDDITKRLEKLSSRLVVSMDSPGAHSALEAAEEIRTLRSKLATSEKDCDEQTEEILELRSRLDEIRTALHLHPDTDHRTVLNTIYAQQGEYARIVETPARKSEPNEGLTPQQLARGVRSGRSPE